MPQSPKGRGKGSLARHGFSVDDEDPDTLTLHGLIGKRRAFAITISTNQVNLNLRNYALAQGWNAADAVFCTISPGVMILSANVGTAALVVNGSFPKKVKLINFGTILGGGGPGGSATGYGTGYSAFGGSAGGPGLQNNQPAGVLEVDNQGIIASGGGGGGAGGSLNNALTPVGGGGR